MTKRDEVIIKLFKENKLKEYDVINGDNINFHIVYGTNIVSHNIVPTITTKGNLFVVIGDDKY